MASSFRDRTNEFHSMCERIRTRTHTPTSILERRALLSPEPSNASITKKNSKKAPHARSEFSVMAAEISRQITNTAGKLEKLTRRKQVQTACVALHDRSLCVCSCQEKDTVWWQACGNQCKEMHKQALEAAADCPCLYRNWHLSSSKTSPN